MIGIAIGIGIAFIGIFACFGTFIIFKYLKRRMLSNRRFAQNGGSATRPKQVNGQRCHNAHELQQLVESNGNGHISMLPTTILDTKVNVFYYGNCSNFMLTSLNAGWCRISKWYLLERARHEFKNYRKSSSKVFIILN